MSLSLCLAKQKLGMCNIDVHPPESGIQDFLGFRFVYWKQTDVQS